MDTPAESRLVLRLPVNRVGTDYFVGDIHGEFDVLEGVLSQRGFDRACDRLIATGDMIDRGRASDRAIEYLEEPWFVSVRGNHEEMLMRWLVHFRGDIGEEDSPELERALIQHANNGGIWAVQSFTDQGQRFRRRWTESIGALPYAIEVPTLRGQTIGVIHAEPPESGTWSGLERALADRRERYHATWARDRLEHLIDATGSGAAVDFRRFDVEGIDLVVVGHNVVSVPFRAGKIAFIDTGSGFPERRLSLLSADEVFGLGDVLLQNAPSAA